MTNSTTSHKPASPAQLALIAKLVAERDFPEPDITGLTGGRDGTASQLISELIAQPRARRPQGGQPEPGIYVLQDGTIVQAKANQRKTNVYTKRWVEIRGTRLVDATEDHVHGEWEYDPGLKAQLPSARRMTLAEARDFILRYGQCVRCGRRLKAAESVERGIGPVCIRYFQQFAA